VASHGQSTPVRAFGQALFAVIAWGASFIATKIALRELDPITLIWARFTIGVAVMGVTTAVRHELSRVPPRELAAFAGLGFIGITLHFWLQSTGMRTTSASTSAWIITTIPAFMAILGWVVLRERVTVWQVAGIALASCGVVAIVSKGDPAALLDRRAGTIGDVLMLLSAPNWAIFSVLSRRILARHPAACALFYVMACGWFFCTILLATHGHVAAIPRMSVNVCVAVAFLGVVCSGLAYVAWYDALKQMPAARAGVFLYVEPLVAMVVAAIILHEPITLASLAGGAMILGGVALVSR
jgi:drug/metabolite transporter (DMT)-like permease